MFVQMRHIFSSSMDKAKRRVLFYLPFDVFPPHVRVCVVYLKFIFLLLTQFSTWMSPIAWSVKFYLSMSTNMPSLLDSNFDVHQCEDVVLVDSIKPSEYHFWWSMCNSHRRKCVNRKMFLFLSLRASLLLPKVRFGKNSSAKYIAKADGAVRRVWAFVGFSNNFGATSDTYESIKFGSEVWTYNLVFEIIWSRGIMPSKFILQILKLRPSFEFKTHIKSCWVLIHLAVYSKAMYGKLRLSFRLKKSIQRATNGEHLCHLRSELVVNKYLQGDFWTGSSCPGCPSLYPGFDS